MELYEQSSTYVMRNLMKENKPSAMFIQAALKKLSPGTLNDTPSVMFEFDALDVNENERVELTVCLSLEEVEKIASILKFDKETQNKEEN